MARGGAGRTCLEGGGLKKFSAMAGVPRLDMNGVMPYS